MLLIFVLMKSQLFPSTKIGVSSLEIYLNIRKCTSLHFRTKLIAIITFFFLSHIPFLQNWSVLLYQKFLTGTHITWSSLFFIFFWTKPEGRTSLASSIIQNFIALFWMCWSFSTLLLKYTHTRTKLTLFYGPVRVT